MRNAGKAQRALLLPTRPVSRYGAPMSDAPDRKARLAAALRANLRRRKAAAEPLADPPPPAGADIEGPAGRDGPARR
jgi:hypothetical protein